MMKLLLGRSSAANHDSNPVPTVAVLSGSSNVSDMPEKTALEVLLRMAIRDDGVAPQSP
jgi:hypothetical protein